jgi:Activator of Hsp90 ATPase homolog 1-like protein
MGVTSVVKDVDRLTLTLVADFAAPPERVWRLWADPRLLERWWGPPSHPATVEAHDLRPGGAVTDVLTGPAGAQARGWWRVTSVDPPTALEFIDGSPTTTGPRSPGGRPPRWGCGSASTRAAPGWWCGRSLPPGSRWGSWWAWARPRCLCRRWARWTPCSPADPSGRPPDRVRRASPCSPGRWTLRGRGGQRVWGNVNSALQVRSKRHGR